MKPIFRILSLILAVAMLATLFASCNQGGENETGTKGDKETETVLGDNGEQVSGDGTGSGEGNETGSATEFVPAIEEKNYDTELYMETYFGDQMLQYMYVEESRGDAVTEALYSRQEKLMEYLGVELIAQNAKGDNDTYINDYTTSIKNKDGSIDLFISQAYVGVVPLVQGGYIQNLKNVEGLNLDADYWNDEYMSSISLYDRYYLGYGDFCIANTFLITYNKTMLEQYGDSLTESVYDSVRNYRWTFDRMISLANLVYADATGDGKTADDTYGMSGNQWIPFIGFLHASNIQLVEENESGDYEVSVFNDKYKEKTVALAEKLKNFASSNAAWFRFRIEPTPVIPLESDRALMVLQNTKVLDILLSYDVEFGVLPYPMFDEAQKDVGYRQLNYDGYITIPAYSRDITMVAESVELLNYWGEDVTVAVYEKLLGKQVADTPDDSAMLRIVWDGICTDFGLTYCTTSMSLDALLYMLPTVTNPNGTEEIASFVAEHSKTANRAIEKFMKVMGKK